MKKAIRVLAFLLILSFASTALAAVKTPSKQICHRDAKGKVHCNTTHK